MTLTEIYEENAAYVRRSGFTVKVDTLHSTVAIEDADGEGFFLQGDEAGDYINEFEAVWNEAGDLGYIEAYYGHAKQYIDSL